MRLGDLDAIEKFIEDGLNNPDKSKAFGHDAIEIMTEVHYAPTIDAVPVVQTPCDFCSKWDWGEAAAVVDLGKYAHIHLAGGSYRFSADKQFNLCPVCGYQNPYKERKDGEG